MRREDQRRLSLDDVECSVWLVKQYHLHAFDMFANAQAQFTDTGGGCLVAISVGDACM